ncbi:hypothetical protein G9U51_10600 [Calidifontibacter sp. DB0510]|uniref:Glycosyltransferase n=1 Tax=Metallococcus carri TaxID=1656884 RepID=A0A967EAT0_9MICO|nr:hypothetical protein [Metallococcus carri]NHN56224.1 hypothetical protein [Metallococcus carri]NOP38725.1 hypothetical protein [Calidifontibacter sp. DB2511S]
MPFRRIDAPPVTGDAPCVVSLTSYGVRIATAHHAIESIAKGSVRPARLVLWLAHDDLATGLPESLLRLRRRGLEIVGCDDHRSHKKYYPYVRSIVRHRLPLVTADDDTLYPSDWLERLLRAHRRAPELVHAQRARRVLLDETGMRPYVEWPLVADRAPSPLVFPTGVGGVIYPAPLLAELRSAGDGFMQLAPSADDAWLHVHAIRAGFVARQVNSRAPRYYSLKRAQLNALWIRNRWAGDNDAQLRRLYGPADLALLARARAA